MTNHTPVLAARIAAAFARAREERRTALIPYVMAGYPDEATSEALAVALCEAGADVLELGVPFSDPLADGATIQHASHQALQNGMTLAGALALAGRVAARIATPLVPMTYYNPIFQFGVEGRVTANAEVAEMRGGRGGEERENAKDAKQREGREDGKKRGTAEDAEDAEDGAPAAEEGALARFAEAAHRAGIAGVIVPDLPPEEAEPLRDALAAHGLALIFLVTPTSPDERIERVARMAETSGGFIYCVALSGVTGARDRLPEQLAAFVGRVRKRATLPLAVGFGVARAEHVAEIGRVADGAVVASALVNATDAAPPDRRVEAAVAFLHEVAQGTRR
ncbi:MAG TPA: tryptophan synthase subunit alpha [Ktedonobacterales bacterium]